MTVSDVYTFDYHSAVIQVILNIRNFLISFLVRRHAPTPIAERLEWFGIRCSRGCPLIRTLFTIYSQKIAYKPIRLVLPEEGCGFWADMKSADYNDHS